MTASPSSAPREVREVAEISDGVLKLSEIVPMPDIDKLLNALVAIVVEAAESNSRSATSPYEAGKAYGLVSALSHIYGLPLASVQKVIEDHARQHRPRSSARSSDGDVRQDRHR